MSGNVNSVTVVGRGAIFCSGNYGDLVGYDANGVELGRTALQLIDAADCSPPDNPDDITFGARATLTVTTGVIARFEITPMSPVTFSVLGNPGGRASQTYTATLDVLDCDLFKDPSAVTDPTLKDPDVQTMLKGLADATNWDKPIEAQAEVGAWIMCNPAGKTELVPWPPVPGLVTNQCLATYDEKVLDGLVKQGYQVLAEVHTHPNVVSGVMYDQNGVKCLDVDQTGRIVPRPYNFPPCGTPPTNKPGSWLFPTDGPSDKDTKTDLENFQRRNRHPEADPFIQSEQVRGESKMSQPMCLRRAFVAALPLLLVAQVAVGQSKGKPCQGPAKPDQASRLFQVLSSPTPQQAEALASIGLRIQATNAPHGVLLETSLCARMRADIRKIVQPPDEPTGGLDQARLSFIELGDYVAVIISDTSPTTTGLRRLGASPVYVFERSKVKFVARLTT